MHSYYAYCKMNLKKTNGILYNILKYSPHNKYKEKRQSKTTHNFKERAMSQ